MSERELAEQAYYAYCNWDFDAEDFYNLDYEEQDKWKNVASHMIDEVGKHIARSIFR